MVLHEITNNIFADHLGKLSSQYTVLPRAVSGLFYFSVAIYHFYVNFISDYFFSPASI